MPTTSQVQRLARRVELLTDAELLALHREVSRLAAGVRARDPEYMRRYQTGMMQARAARGRYA